MRGKSQVLVETRSRPRCPRDHYLLDHNNKCWFCGQTPAERISVMQYEPKVDLETGEQLSLSGELFARYEVPTVRVTIGGAVEVPVELPVLPGLGPGDMATCLVRVYVADVSAPYAEGKGHRGRVVLRVVGVDGVEVM
jgi:hypothetical protein